LRWLLDEMLPPPAAALLRDLGHDAVSVLEIGLAAASDDVVYERAVRDQRVMVTENFADYAIVLRERQMQGRACVPVVFVRRVDLPRRGALASRLVARLVAWGEANPEPAVGLHWP
jgi:predicted nuclease of predicted toxin-antitoxin system